MDDRSKYEDFIRNRITQLRMEKNVSEHRMSLELGRSGAYIRSISNGSSLPSVKELLNIIDYFEIEPAEFFQTFTEASTPQLELCERIRGLDGNTISKVNTFLDLLE